MRKDYDYTLPKGFEKSRDFLIELNSRTKGLKQ